MGFLTKSMILIIKENSCLLHGQFPNSVTVSHDQKCLPDLWPTKDKPKAIPFPRTGTRIGSALQECYCCPCSPGTAGTRWVCRRLSTTLLTCLQWRIIVPGTTRELFWNSQPLCTAPLARKRPTASHYWKPNDFRSYSIYVDRSEWEKTGRDSPEAKCLTTSLWHWFQCPALNKKRASLCRSPSILARTAFASWIHSAGTQSLCVRKVSLAHDSGVSDSTQCRCKSSRTAFSRMLVGRESRSLFQHAVLWVPPSEDAPQHKELATESSSRGLHCPYWLQQRHSRWWASLTRS